MIGKLHRFTLAATLLATFALAQDPPAEPQPPLAGAPTLPGPGRGAPTGDPQPYDRVITKDAKSKIGIFTVHQIKDRYYFEISK